MFAFYLLSFQQVAPGSLAVGMQHNHPTQAKHYPSHHWALSRNASNLYHQSLGANLDSWMVGTVRDEQYSDAQLLAALRKVLNNESAEFRQGQLELCRAGIGQGKQNSFCDFPTGTGKSIVQYVPLMTREMFGSVEGCAVVVVVPDSTLTCQQYNKAVEVFAGTSVTVSMYRQTDIMSETTGIMDENLVFLTLNAWRRITADHPSLVMRWKDEKAVSLIVVDEVHFVWDQSEIRLEDFASLKFVAGLEAPIVAMSATVPAPLRKPLLRFMRLSDSCVRLSAGAYPTPDVAVSVHLIERKHAVSEAMALICSQRLQRSTGAIHCIVNSKSIGKEIFGECRFGQVESCAYIDGDSGLIERNTVARSWYKGELELLISTTGTGFDNLKCECVIAVSGVWSLLSLVQYLGRELGAVLPSRRRYHHPHHMKWMLPIL